MNSGINVFKYCTFLFNFFVFLSGMVMLAVGILGLTDKAMVEVRDYRTLFIAVTVIGSLTLIFSLIGCCALVTESPGALHTYTFLSFIAAFTILVVGILCFVYKTRVSENAYTSMGKRFNKFGKNLLNNKTHLSITDKLIVEQAQERLHCCGWDANYMGSDEYPPGTQAVPSCTCFSSRNNCSGYQYYKDTCEGKIKKSVSRIMIGSGWVCMILMIFPICGTIITAHLAKRAKEYQRFGE